MEKVRNDIRLCLRCGFCKQWDWGGTGVVCPVYPFTLGFETHYARGRVWQAKALLKKSVDITDSFAEAWELQIARTSITAYSED